MIKKGITIALVLIFIVTIAGCVSNGDIGTAIEKWNKVVDKTQEIRLLEEQLIKTGKADNVIIEAEMEKASSDFKKILPLLDKQQEMLDDEKKLLEEKSSLISDFAGATVNLNGDAKKYADRMLSNLREEHRYWTSSVDNSNRALESLRTYYKTLDEKYYRQYEQYFNAADSDATKSNSYTYKTNDDMKKLEALQ